MNFLITAGGTREYIDPVRFISNASSGRMGHALAQAAIKAGHKVTLITTVKKSEIRNQNSEVKIVDVKTAEEMFIAVKRFFPECDCLIMAAAVSDYTPIKKSKIKIKKSNKNLVIKLKPTTDILKWAGEENKKWIRPVRQAQGEQARHSSKIKNKKAKMVVGFALEDKNLRRNAERKLKEKNLDMIVVNTVAAIGAEEAAVHIKTANGRWVKMSIASKAAIAGKIVHVVEDLFWQRAKL